MCLVKLVHLVLSAFDGQHIMAESSPQPSATSDLLIECRTEEQSVSTGSFSKELMVTAAEEGSEIPRSNGTANSTFPANVLEEEATPTPPESSPSLSSENATLTIVTTEDETLSVLLKQNKNEGRPDREEPGKMITNCLRKTIF